MLKITVQGDTRQRLTRAVQDMDRRLPELLQEIGVSLLSNARLDFEVKSRGGTGAGGIRWAALAESTEKQKARRGRKPKKTKKGTKRKKDSVTGAKVGKSQIGVNTGLLRNSSTPGFQGPDGAGGNVLEVTGHQVTVGFGRTYAKHFDGGGRGPARPLLPEELPQEWEGDTNAIVDDWLRDVFGEGEL
jgi:hypothetical protein